VKKKVVIISFTLVFLLLIGGLAYSYNTPNHKLDRQLKLGNKCLKEHKYQEAILAFTKVIKIDAKTIAGRLGIAEAYMNTKDLAKAEKMLKEAIAIDPTNIAARENLINVYITQVKVAEAEKLIEQIAIINPSINEVELKNNISTLKELENSKENYDKALQLMKEKKYKEAIALFRKVILKDTERYSDSQNKIEECRALYAAEELKKQQANQLITEAQAMEIACKYAKQNYDKFSAMSEGQQEKGGKKYYEIRIFEDLPDCISTLAWYYIDQNGGAAYKWDITTDTLTPLR